MEGGVMNRSRFLLLFILICIPLGLNAQIQVRLHQPPPNQLLIEHLWWVDLNNMTGETYTVYLYAEIIEAQKGVLFRTSTNNFSLPTGSMRIRPSDITGIHDTWYSPEYRDIIIRTGHLPEGDYTVCVYVRQVPNEQELGFHCINQMVYLPGALHLISPIDNAIVKENNPIFTWARPAPLPPNTRVTYDLKIVEILEGQTKEEALRSNIPWFEMSGITGTVFRYPIDARILDRTREYTWQVEAFYEGGFPIVASEEWVFARDQIHFTPVLERYLPLKITREVVRHNNWYEVKLNLINMSSENITNIVVIDSNVGVQCIDTATYQLKTSGQYFMLAVPVQSEVQNSSSGLSSSIRIELRTSDWLDLAPGKTIIVRYSVVPVMYHTSGPYYLLFDYTIGKQIRVTYTRDGEQEATARPGLAEDLSNSINLAFGSADYLIATSPSLLFAHNPGNEEDVNKLLSGMAKLARAKNGVLGYTSALTHTVFRTLIAPGGKWSNKLSQGWTQAGYLLVVGESEIIPHWSIITHVPKRSIKMSDHFYADIAGDWRPELSTGRIVGGSAHDLLIPIEHSLAVHYNLGAENDGSQAYFAAGVEKVPDNFTPAAEEGAAYVIASKGMTAFTFGQEFISTRERILGKALQHTPVGNGGAHPDSSLSGYTQNQRAAWLWEITIGKAAFDAQFPHNLGDQLFSDTEGRFRRVPVNFSNSDLNAAVYAAEVVENSRRPGYDKAYIYMGDWNAALNMIISSFNNQLPRHDVTFFSAHGEYSVFGALSATHVFGMDLTSHGIRPIIISFACYNGEYERNGNPGIVRAFLRQGAAAFIGYTEMTNVGWWGTEVGNPNNLLQYWYKQKRIGLIFRDWKIFLALATGGYCTDYDANCRMLFGTNLYGDPKFGGN